MNAMRTARSRRRSWQTRVGEALGQTLTEYLMILGILTALIIGLTQMIVPTLAWVISRLLNHMVVFVSSV